MNHLMPRLNRQRIVGICLAISITVMLVCSPTYVSGLPNQATEQPTEPPIPLPIAVFRTEPMAVQTGASGMLSIFGQNFTSQTVVRLIGFGVLATTRVNSTILTAAIPDSLLPGQYTIEISDPLGGVVTSPNPLLVTAGPYVPPTAEPLPTDTPQPTETAVPTPRPGQPILTVRAFSVQPTTIDPGESVSLTMEILNQGNRTAQGVAVTLDTGSKFVAAQGQAGATVRAIGAGAAEVLKLKVTAAKDAPAGPNSIPIVMSYYDFEGKTFTNKASLTVNVREIASASQIVLADYEIAPNPAIPGQAVALKIKLENRGNRDANQVMVKFPEKDALLLAGRQGSTFAAGTVLASTTSELNVNMILSRAAKAGPQAQPFSIIYQQGDKSVEVITSLTISVASVQVAEPLILLTSYQADTEILTPGQDFSFTFKLRNNGTAPANNMTLTFGTIEGGSGTSSDSGSSGTPSSSQSSTTPNDSFAPVGFGGTLYIGTLAPDQEIEVTQQFIVNSKLASGIFTLPITVRYQGAEGSNVQSVLRASMTVVDPASVVIKLNSPLPPSANVGEPVSIALRLTNLEKDPLILFKATTKADNASIMQGEETELQAVNTDEEVAIDAVVVPTAAGKVEVTITIYYQNDLRRMDKIERVFTFEAIEPPPQPTFEVPTITETSTPVPTPDSSDVLGRFLRGLLGLGS